MSCAKRRAAMLRRSAASRLSRKRTSLSPNTSTRPGRMYSGNPASASPVFCTWGLCTRRPRPWRPATISTTSSPASRSGSSSMPTATAGGMDMGGGLPFRFHESPKSPPARRISTLRPSVSALRNSRNGSPLAASSMAALSTDIGLNCVRVTRTTRGPLAARGAGTCGPRRRGDRVDAAACARSTSPSASPPGARILSTAAGQHRRSRSRPSVRVESMWSPLHVHGDVGLAAVLLAAQDDLADTSALPSRRSSRASLRSTRRRIPG